ncbi:MAG: hypothetical protein LBT12_06915 [Oscillospiraceae bacterium]|jgi:hypothetical protein|nr:hypothetical protein [Oscillospiraceae bacterium]
MKKSILNLISIILAAVMFAGCGAHEEPDVATSEVPKLTPDTSYVITTPTPTDEPEVIEVAVTPEINLEPTREEKIATIVKYLNDNVVEGREYGGLEKYGESMILTNKAFSIKVIEDMFLKDVSDASLDNLLIICSYNDDDAIYTILWLDFCYAEFISESDNLQAAMLRINELILRQVGDTSNLTREEKVLIILDKLRREMFDFSPDGEYMGLPIDDWVGAVEEWFIDPLSDKAIDKLYEGNYNLVNELSIGGTIMFDMMDDIPAWESYLLTGEWSYSDR